MERPIDKTSQDQVRESLIAIAYSSPEESSSSEVKKPDSNGITNVVTKGDTDDAERLRSEFISISYNDSQDVAVSPTPPNGVCQGQ